MAAPGRQRATFSGSVRKLHTCSGAERTTNVLTMSKPILASGSEEAEGIGEELLAAARVAEEVVVPGVRSAVARGLHLDGHAAHRIGLLRRRFRPGGRLVRSPAPEPALPEGWPEPLAGARRRRQT